MTAANNDAPSMTTNAKPEEVASTDSIYGACTKKTLLRIAKSLGISPTSAISREELIKQIDAERPRVSLRSEDLLSPFRPFLSALNREINQARISDREQDLVKEKFLEIFGSSLSRLPYLANKTTPDKKDWMSIQTISMNLELLHEILGTSPICKAGTVLSYDPNIHEGPSGLERGQDCIAVSTGIKRGDLILIKTFVITTEGK